MKLPFERIKRRVIVKFEAETSEEHGCRPEQRNIASLLKNGFVNLDKPSGPTSHQVTAWVKRILNLKKAGHGGTLDPAVVGVLPIALENATKVVRALLLAGKEYVCLMHLHKDVAEEKIRKVMQKFVGKIKQVPPVKARVKRVEREREIYYVKILEISGRDVLFLIGCEAGFYVRKFCDDFGRKLGIRAHMLELRRTKVGPFKEEYHLVTLQDLSDAYYFWKEKEKENFLRYCVLPLEFGIYHLPKIWVQDNAIDALCHGAPLALGGVVKFESGIEEGILVALMSLKNELVALGISKLSSAQIEKRKRGIVAAPSRVVMPRGTYPRRWK
jgi:H/ACA ribonucleoprotein complex subunit 4